MKILQFFVFLFSVSVHTLCADTNSFYAASPIAEENLAMIAEYHLAIQPVPLAYELAAIQMMLHEANQIADRLKLPASRPIQPADIQYPYVSAAWYSILKEATPPYWPITIFSNRIFDSSIPREKRVRSFKICLRGTIETTNFLFAFNQGNISDVERLTKHEVQYYSRDLDKLINQPSSINDMQAHEMATQWLNAVSIDVLALERKYKPQISHLMVLPKDSKSAVEVPIYLVHWGWQYFRNGDANHSISSNSIVEVKILGTTKELLELRLSAMSFSRRPLLLITNAIDLIRMPRPAMKRLEFLTPQTVSPNSVSPQD